MLDFGRFGGPPQGAAGQGRPLGYLQGGFLDDSGYGSLEEDWSGAQQGSPAAVAGGYTAYASAQAQASCSGAFSASTPPAFPPPQPPAGMAAGHAEFGFQGNDFPALGALGRQDSNPILATSGQLAAAAAQKATASGRAGHLGPAAELARAAALQAQPPPPPSQAPHVPPAQPWRNLEAGSRDGPPPLSPLVMSPPAQPWLRPGEMSEEDRRREEQEDRAAREKYGLLGILKVIRMTNPDLNALALGMDLTTLGLNLNSPECLHATFASPWSDTPARKDPEFCLPPCYYMNPPQLKTAHLQKFSLETLFYIFFNMPRDTLQAYAAAELYNRGWKYHRELKAWFALQEEEGSSRWVCFDPNTWEKLYYMQPVDSGLFLAEDDVRVKMSPGAGMPEAASQGV